MTDMLGPAVRMVVSLAIVLGLMYAAARLMSRGRGISPRNVKARARSARAPRASLMSSLTGAVTKPKRGRRPARAGARLELVARQPLGKTSSVAVVRVAGRTLLLGVTDSAVQLLSEFDSALFEEPAEAAEHVGAVEARPASLPSPSEPRSVPARTHTTSVSMLEMLRERTVRRA